MFALAGFSANYLQNAVLIIRKESLRPGSLSTPIGAVFSSGLTEILLAVRSNKSCEKGGAATLLMEIVLGNIGKQKKASSHDFRK